MAKGKKFRQAGKIKLSDYFKKFNENDSVCVIREPSIKCSFPKRIIGRSGKISGIRGSHYLVRLNDLDKEKTFIIHPIHLKLLNKQTEKKSEKKETKKQDKKK